MSSDTAIADAAGTASRASEHRTDRTRRAAVVVEVEPDVPVRGPRDVPGTVRGLALAHKRFGKLPWADVVRPAAQLATTGFRLSKALSGSLNNTVERFMAPFPSSVAVYGKPGGGKWAEGDTIRLTDLGRTLEAIASGGPDAFYTGWIADSLAAQMKANGGLITKADLAAYQAKERDPVRGTFNGYEIIAMGPPSSGGAVMLETLDCIINADEIASTFGLDVVTRMCASLVERGAPGLHFYTLNQPTLTASIWRALGLT